MDPPKIIAPEGIPDRVRSDFIGNLLKVGVIKFGNFKLKSGVQSPIYVDLRELISHMKELKTAARMISAQVSDATAVPYDIVCGVPYGALSIATLVASEKDTPMVMRRKEAKDHGTKKIIEGRVIVGNRCLIVDDVCTSGQSIMETADDLRAAGLVVEHAAVLLDRESGGTQYLRQHGIQLHTSLTLQGMCHSLHDSKKIKDDLYKQVIDFIRRSAGGVVERDGASARVDWKKVPFGVRLKHVKNPVARRLFDIMLKKHTTLAVAADLSTAKEILTLCDAVGPHICVLKLHVDFIEDFSDEFRFALQKKARKYEFLLMEDRKFCDIGNTVSRQISSAPQKLAEWTDLVTAHAISGPGVITGLKDGITRSSGINRQIGIVFVAEMSSADSLADQEYARKTVRMLESFPENVAGLVCQTDISDSLGYIRMAPGVSLEKSRDDLGQRYSSPEEAMRRSADVIIVGRGITGNIADPSKMAAAASLYKTKAWAAYMDRIGTILSVYS